MYYVNKGFVKLVRMFIPLGITLLLGFFLESLAVVKNFSIVFLVAGVVSNMYFPEMVIIEENKLKLKLTLTKKFKEYMMNELVISVDKRARYLILHLDRKYRLELMTMSKDLYYQLKPYIKVQN